MRRSLIFTGLLLIGTAACDGSTGAREPGWMKASLSGAVSGTYEGNGNFLVQTDRPEGPRRMFTLDSWSDSPRYQQFGFTRQNGTRPAPGRYPLELVAPGTSGDRFFAGYQRTAEVEEYYTATSGWVEITESTEDRVAGTFYFVGKRYCTNEPKPCAMPWAPPADAPEIEVTGSFSVIPDDPRVDW